MYSKYNENKPKGNSGPAHNFHRNRQRSSKYMYRTIIILNLT